MESTENEIINLPWGDGPTTDQLHQLLAEQGQAARERGSRRIHVLGGSD
jgi:hypothetical protein